MYYTRHMTRLLTRIMQQFPAILVAGPRQVGKSTLLQRHAPHYAYVSFDDPLILAQAKNEPHLFIKATCHGFGNKKPTGKYIMHPM